MKGEQEFFYHYEGVFPNRPTHDLRDDNPKRFITPWDSNKPLKKADPSLSKSLDATWNVRHNITEEAVMEYFDKILDEAIREDREEFLDRKKQQTKSLPPQRRHFPKASNESKSAHCSKQTPMTSKQTPIASKQTQSLTRDQIKNKSEPSPYLAVIESKPDYHQQTKPTPSRLQQTKEPAYNQATKPPANHNQPSKPPPNHRQATKPLPTYNQATYPPSNHNQPTKPPLTRNQATRPLPTHNQATYPPSTQKQATKSGFATPKPRPPEPQTPQTRTSLPRPLSRKHSLPNRPRKDSLKKAEVQEPDYTIEVYKSDSVRKKPLVRCDSVLKGTPKLAPLQDKDMLEVQRRIDAQIQRDSKPSRTPIAVSVQKTKNEAPIAVSVQKTKKEIISKRTVETPKQSGSTLGKNRDSLEQSTGKSSSNQKYDTVKGFDAFMMY